MSDTSVPRAGWDPLVRLTHWGTASAVLLNGVLVEGDGQAHLWIGYAALTFLGLRLIWGLVGPREARFSAFRPSLARARDHLGDIWLGRRVTHRSHNPLGALMAYTLWALLALVVGTGLMMETGAGGDLEDLHSAAAYLVLLLAPIHVAGVLFEKLRGDGDVIRRMITGEKRE